MPPRRAITGRSQEPRRRFAEELRLLRTQRGVSLRELAKAVGWDASQFGKMESGQTLGGPEIVEALDTYYGTPSLLLTLWDWRWPIRRSSGNGTGATWRWRPRR